MAKRKSMIVPKPDPSKNKCYACNGSGYWDNTVKGKIPKCSACGGTGKQVVDS